MISPQLLKILEKSQYSTRVSAPQSPWSVTGSLQVSGLCDIISHTECATWPRSKSTQNHKIRENLIFSSSQIKLEVVFISATKFKFSRLSHEIFTVRFLHTVVRDVDLTARTRTTDGYYITQRCLQFYVQNKPDWRGQCETSAFVDIAGNILTYSRKVKRSANTTGITCRNISNTVWIFID